MKLLPSYCGLLVEREINMLERVATNVKHPFVVVLGGGKTSDKIPVIQRFLATADAMLLGGGPANVFLKAAGVAVGTSLIESDRKHGRQTIVATAKRLRRKQPTIFHLPTDLVAANRFNQQAVHEVVDLAQKQRIKKDWMFLDIGPATVSAYCQVLQKAKTIFWNGPMGVYEFARFAHGSREVAQCIARNKQVTILGGGDTQAVIGRYGLGKRYTHVSSGGGASLAFIAGQELPGLTALGYKRKQVS